jgi:hypothetical protein
MAEAPTVQTISTEEKQHWLSVLIEERKHRLSEMLDYNKRMDRTIVFYLSAAYAAIGLRATGTLDLSKALTDDTYVWLVLLFIFLNGCILIHGISQSSWCVALAKFVHVKLDSELLALAGKGGQAMPQSQELSDVGPLGWDDWEKEIKQLGVETRGWVVLLWTLLVVASSTCSLTFVNVPRFLLHLRWPGYVVLALVCLVLSVTYAYAFFRLCSMHSYLRGGRYHALKVCLRPSDRCKTLVLALALTVGFLASSCVIASFPQSQGKKTNSGTASSPAKGVHGQKGTRTQPGSATVSPRPSP